MPETVPAPVAIERDGHRTWLKWHRGHKRKGDVSFTRDRIAEGLAAGAAVEIDLLCHAGGGFAVLHDETLDKATTGAGRVADATAGELRGLFLRDHEGNPTREPVLLIGDLAELLRGDAMPGAGLLQLDLKESATGIGPDHVATFGRVMEPVAARTILSGGDKAALAMLSGSLPQMPLGFDPCHTGARNELARTQAYSDFVAATIAASPAARMIYLEYELVLQADQHGFDLIAAFHAAGRTIDAYTISRPSPALLPQIGRLLELRVDQITTDDAEGMLALLG